MNEILKELLIGGYYASIVILGIIAGLAWSEHEWGTVVACILIILLILGARIALMIVGRS